MAIKVLGQEATDKVIKEIKKRGKKKVNAVKTYTKYNITNLTVDQAYNIKHHGAKINYYNNPVPLSYDELDQSAREIIDATINKHIKNKRHFTVIYDQSTFFYKWPIKVLKPKISQGKGSRANNWMKVVRKYELVKSSSVASSDDPDFISKEKLALAQRARYIMKNSPNINRIDLYFSDDWNWGNNFEMIIYYFNR